MYILALETSTALLSIALSNNTILLEEITISKPHVASERCAIEVNAILERQNLTANDLDFIAINCGPGSFTGLRVGLSFAKGLAFSKPIPMIGITAVESLFYGLNSPDSKCVVIESKRDEVYVSLNGIDILVMPKTELSQAIAERAIVTNNEKDLRDFVINPIEIRPFTAKQLCLIAYEKIQEKSFEPSENLDALYIKGFAGGQ